jgi:Sap, sulfolipid-1-addressing protein
LSGAREARKQTEGLVGEDSDDYRHRQATLEDFEAAAISMFGEPIRVKRQYRLGGQEYPGHRDLIVEASRVAKVGLPDRVIRGTYALMSNSVHPTPHSIRELFHVEQHGSEATATLARPADFHENLTKMVVFYFYNALTYVMSFPGVSYLDALDHIHKLNPRTVPIVLLVLFFCLMQQILLEVPLLGYVFAPDSTQARVTRFRAWMGRKGRPAAVIGAGVIGVWLVARGVITLL